MLDYKENDPTLESNSSIRINYSNKQTEVDSKITPDIEDYIETQYSIINDSQNESKTIEKPTENPVIYDINPEKYSEVAEDIQDTIIEPHLNPQPKIKPKSKPKLKLNLNTDKLKHSNRIETAKISGTVLDHDTCKPICCATISLFRKYLDCKDKLVTTTNTDKDGKYIFSNVTAGLYFVKITANCYTTKCFCTAMLTSLTPVSITTTLKNNGTTSDSNCSIFGVINNSSNNPIGNASVVLYSVDSKDNSTPVASTTTDSCGNYTFKNIPIGNYKVTANNVDISTLSIDGTSKNVQIYNN